MFDIPNMSLVVPAVLPSSREDFEAKLALFIELPSVTRIQIDVVDGRFAAPASWPYTAPMELRHMVDHGELLPQLDHIAYEIDLMCFDALHAVEDWLALGASRFTFHAESATDIARLLASARERHGHGHGLVSFGLALNTVSSLALIEPCLADIEYVQCMGIERIGRQGQPFDSRVLEKVRTFAARHPDIAIQVDGGISLERARELVSLGVSNLVIGSALLRASDPATVIETFEKLETPYGV